MKGSEFEWAQRAFDILDVQRRQDACSVAESQERVKNYMIECLDSQGIQYDENQLEIAINQSSVNQKEISPFIPETVIKQNVSHLFKKDLPYLSVYKSEGEDLFLAHKILTTGALVKAAENFLLYNNRRFKLYIASFLFMFSCFILSAIFIHSLHPAVIIFNVLVGFCAFLYYPATLHLWLQRFDNMRDVREALSTKNHSSLVRLFSKIARISTISKPQKINWQKEYDSFGEVDGSDFVDMRSKKMLEFASLCDSNPITKKVLSNWVNSGNPIAKAEIYALKFFFF